MPSSSRARIVSGLGGCLLAAGLLILSSCASPAPADRAVVANLDSAYDSTYTGAELDVPYDKPAGDFTATTPSGQTPYSFIKDATDPVTLVFFGYTSCPDVCNTVLADLATALRTGDAAVRARTQVVFVTTDPKRDTPEVMRSYLDGFDPSFVGLTASMPTIEAAARNLGVSLTGNTALRGGGYDVGHSSQVIGFGPDGRAHVVWLPDELTVDGLRTDLTKLVAA